MRAARFALGDLVGLMGMGLLIGGGACAAGPKAGDGGGGPGAGLDCSENLPLGSDTISDFESGSGVVLPWDGRRGGWYAYNDRSATCVEDPAPGAPDPASAPLETPRCGSTAAFRARGMGCSTWGAGVGADLAAPAPVDGAAGSGSAPTRKITYDLSGFRAISFWGRVGAGATGAVRFKLPMLADTKIVDGGLCQLSEIGTDKCSDDWGRPLIFSTAWKLFTVPLVDDSGTGLSTEGWGKQFPLDLTNVVAIQFQVAANTTFDVWIDDVNLTRK